MSNTHSETVTTRQAPSPRPERHPPNDTANSPSGATARGIAERAAVRRASGIKAERLDPLAKAARNPKSLRLAVNAKCFDCEGGDSDPNVRLRIGTCEIRTCPLWPVRPYQRLAGNERRTRRDLQLGRRATGSDASQ
jgi:hypothetical protein